MAVDPCSFNFTKPDAVWVKLKTSKHSTTSESVWVPNGVEKYRLAILPVVLSDSVKIGADSSRWIDLTGINGGVGHIDIDCSKKGEILHADNST